MTLELVTWRDAFFEQDELRQDVPKKDYLVQTVGWTKTEKNFLAIRSERLPRKEGWRAVTRVPHAMIISRVALREDT